MVYLFSDLPYVKAYHNWRTCIVHSAGLTGLFMAMYYRSMKSTTPIDIRTQIFLPAIILLGSLMLAIAVSVVSLCYELMLKLIELFSKKKEEPELEKEIIKVGDASQVEIQNSCVLETIPDQDGVGQHA